MDIFVGAWKRLCREISLTNHPEMLALSSTESQVDNGDDDITRNGAIAGVNEYLESSSGRIR